MLEFFIDIMLRCCLISVCRKWIFKRHGKLTANVWWFSHPRKSVTPCLMKKTMRKSRMGECGQLILHDFLQESTTVTPRIIPVSPRHHSGNKQYAVSQHRYSSGLEPGRSPGRSERTAGFGVTGPLAVILYAGSSLFNVLYFQCSLLKAGDTMFHRQRR